MMMISPAALLKCPPRSGRKRFGTVPIIGRGDMSGLKTASNHAGLCTSESPGCIRKLSPQLMIVCGLVRRWCKTFRERGCGECCSESHLISKSQMIFSSCPEASVPDLGAGQESRSEIRDEIRLPGNDWRTPRQMATCDSITCISSKVRTSN